MVLDPCLQFGHLIPKTPLWTDGKPYAVVYGHGFPDWLTSRIVQWATGEGVRLVSVGYDNPWADEQRIDAGPMEFAAMMAGSRGVVTNFFHGCVFALVNGKPFVTAPYDYRFNKVRDLVAALGAERHMVSEATEIEAIMSDILDPRIAHAIATMRVQSDSYLDHALG